MSWSLTRTLLQNLRNDPAVLWRYPGLDLCRAGFRSLSDMGLISSALEAFYVGACCALMAPAAFVQRPMVWLKAIPEYRGGAAPACRILRSICV